MWRVFWLQDERLMRAVCRKDEILEQIRRNGMRITSQRRLILDIVLEHECTCCKEIYYQALKKDKNMGIATVYRMVNMLTDLGILQMNSPYQFSDRTEGEGRKGCRILLKDQEEVELDQEEWQSLLMEALHRKGYMGDIGIERVILQEE